MKNIGILFKPLFLALLTNLLLCFAQAMEENSSFALESNSLSDSDELYINPEDPNSLLQRELNEIEKLDKQDTDNQFIPHGPSPEA